MYSYQETTAWWTAPASWRSSSGATASTRGSTRAVTAGGVPAAGTSRGTTSHYTQQEALSTASTSSTISTSSGAGGAPAGGGNSGFTSSTFADTASAYTNALVSTSDSYTRTLPLSYTTTSSELQGQWSTTGTTVSSALTRTWPSTLTVPTTTGTPPATGTTTTRTCSTAVTGNATLTLSSSTAPTTGPEYTAPQTYVTTSTTTTGTGQSTTRNTTVLSHKWLALPDTVVHADASGGHLLNNVLVWYMPGITAATSGGLFGGFFTTLASAGTPATASAITSWITTAATVWQTWSLSTAQVAATETTTGTTSTDTGTVLTTAVASSLNGSPWDSAGAASSSTLFLGTLTGSSTYTVPGPATLTDYTYTLETTSYGALSQFARATVTETAAVEVSISRSWHTWERSYTTSSSFPYPVSTTTGATISSYSTNGWLLGSATISSAEWQILTTSASWTDRDGLTNAILIGTFTSTGSSGGGANATTESVLATVGQTWDRTDREERIYLPTAFAQSDHEFARFPRFRERRMARGFLGFGDGFDDTSPVYAGLTSSVASGDGDPSFSLVASQMPRFIFRPAASIFATGPCWIEGTVYGWSSVSATWLGSDTGPRLTASLAHRWLSTSSTVTGTSTITVTAEKSATYICGVTGSISGEFFSEYEPLLNTTASGIGRPDLYWLATQSGGGPAGGTPAIASAAVSATFPPGAISLTWESAPGATSSSSTSNSSGELTLALAAGTNPVAFSYEEAVRFSWSRQTDLQLETASRHYLPPNPWTADLH